MQSTQRLEDNWALRFAILEADRLGRPLLVLQLLEPDGGYTSDRFHRFVLEGAREVAAGAEARGLCFRFALRRRVDDDDRLIQRLAARACMVITDAMPTDGVDE